jgi:hypothetical protein
MREPFDFRQQLRVGDNGEADFVKYYKNLAPKKSTNRKIDFYLGDGTTVELKTDSYDMNKTANFFMELYSDMETGAIGGPWRALRDELDFFVYYFPRNQTFFWFTTGLLVARIDLLISQHKYTLRTIRNKDWSGQGYTIPRELLEEVLFRVDKF